MLRRLLGVGVHDVDELRPAARNWVALRHQQQAHHGRGRQAQHRDGLRQQRATRAARPRVGRPGWPHHARALGSALGRHEVWSSQDCRTIHPVAIKNTAMAVSQPPPPPRRDRGGEDEGMERQGRGEGR